MKQASEIDPSRGGQGRSIPNLRRGTISFRERLQQWLSDNSNLCFALLIVIHLIPIWSFEYFPTQDGAAHLYNATVLGEYHRPDRPIFREYYALNKHFVPNLFGHLILAGLMYFLPMLIAEKVFLSSYVLLLPLAIRYVLLMIRPDAGFLTLLTFPFIYNYMLHLGFYNFSYSLVMFFFVVGYWLKHYEKFTLRNTIILAILTLGLYSCHIVSLMTAYVMIVLFIVWLMFLDLTQRIRQRQCNFQALWATLRTRALAPLCALLPTFLLVATFLFQHGGPLWYPDQLTVDTSTLAGSSQSQQLYALVASRTERLTEKLISRAERLYHLDSLISYDESEGWLSTALVWLFVAVLVYLLVLRVARRGRDRWDGLLLVAAGYAVIYFITPSNLSQGAFMSERMNLYPFLALILWFGAQSYHRVAKWGIQVVATGIALAFLGLHMQKYAEFNDYLKEFVSGSHLITSNVTLLPFNFSFRFRMPDGRILSSRIGLAGSGYIAAQRHIVDLQNYEARETVFPVMYRSHLNPYVYIYDDFALGDRPPDFLSYPQRTGGHVDYVLIWHTGKESWDDSMRQLDNALHQHEQFIFRQLQESYELIYTSPQRGFMRLYRRKDWKLAS